MENLTFDTGIRSYQINGGPAVLRINPSDSNMYSRFFDALDKLTAVEERLTRQPPLPSDGAEASRAALALLEEADRQAKAILGEALGCGNDLDAIFEGQNCLAVASNGERLLTNFINAITPLLQQGIQQLADGRAQAVLAERSARPAAEPEHPVPQGSAL